MCGIIAENRGTGKEQEIMKYFLIIGLMMMSSLAQADICNSLWWQSAIPSQVEAEAELKGPSAMNMPCPNGAMPLTLALENNNNSEVFSAIMEQFNLDEEARSQVTEHVANIQFNQHLKSISRLFELLSSGELESPLPYVSNEDYVATLLRLLSLTDEYMEYTKQR